MVRDYNKRKGGPTVHFLELAILNEVFRSFVQSHQANVRMVSENSQLCNFLSLLFGHCKVDSHSFLDAVKVISENLMYG